MIKVLVKKQNYILVVLLLVLITSPRVWSQSAVAKFSLIGDVSHLEFEGLSQWDYEVEEKSQSEVWISVPRLSDISKRELLAWRDSRIKEVSVDLNSETQKSIIKIKFSQDYIESFDYLTDSPSRLIVDFYKDQDKELQARKKAETEQKNVQKKKTALAEKKQKTERLSGSYAHLNKKDRSPSGGELISDSGYLQKEGENSELVGVKRGVFDSGDPNYDRFRIKDYEISEESIIASRQNVYIHFPMLKMPTSQLSELLQHPPEYKIKPKDDLENKEARFLLTLFNNGRNAVFLDTYQYFNKKYPESYYSEILSYMAADVHFKLWRETGHPHHFENAKKIFTKVLKTNPNSPLKERITLLLDYAELENKNSLETIRNFLKFNKDFPDSENRNQSQMALAEGYFMLNKFDQALGVYADIEKNYTDFDKAVEASYRRGDVYFKKNELEQATVEYLQAIKKQPKYEGKFPNAHYNLAESYFWLGKYKESLDHYIKYLKYFPDHEHNGYAMTRIGELLEILGASKEKVMSAFLESYFRYEGSPGAKIARVRMLSQRMKGMKEKELDKTLDELKEISKTTPLPKIDEFVTLMITDGFRRRSEYDKAIEYLITYYQKNPTTVSLSFFKDRIVGNIVDSINEKLSENKYFEALKINGRYTKTWLRKNGRFDIDYFKGKSFELAGVYNEAEKIYVEVLDHLIKIKGTREELERKVREYLPSIESLYLRLAKVTWQQKKYSESYNYLRKISDLNRLSGEEKVEQVRLFANLYKERGNYSKAIEYLVRLTNEWKDKPQLLAPTYLILSDMQLKNGQLQDSEKSSQKTIDLYTELKGEDHDKYLAEAIKIKADSLYLQKKHLASVELYLDLLKNYENKITLDSTRFRAGDILFQKGDIKGAEKVWSSFKPEDDDLYKKLADEKLKDMQWKETYKKYYKRIPAMSGVK